MIVGNLICVAAGAALVGLPDTQVWGRLVALWLCSCQSVGFAMSLTMISSNIAGYTKKQVCSRTVILTSSADPLILTSRSREQLCLLVVSWYSSTLRDY